MLRWRTLLSTLHQASVRRTVATAAVRRPRGEARLDVRSAFTEGASLVISSHVQPKVCEHSRHHPGGRFRHPALSRDPRSEQTAPAGLRQADDLLPVVYTDARRDT